MQAHQCLASSVRLLHLVLFLSCVCARIRLPATFAAAALAVFAALSVIFDSRETLALSLARGWVDGVRTAHTLGQKAQ